MAEEIKAGVSWISWKYMIVIAILLASLKLGGGMVAAAHVGLALWALLGVPQTIQALSLAVVIKYLNPVLYTFPEGVGVLGWLVIMLGGIRLLLAGRLKNLTIVLPLIGFSLVVAALFVVQDNKAPAVSAMKLFMFTFISCAVLLGASSLKEEQADHLGTWFSSLICVTVVLSLPLFVFPTIGYAKNGQGFQGIFSHPQTFGPILAPTASALLASVFFCKPKNVLSLSSASLMLIGLMVASQARTALATVILSLAATAVVVLLRSRRFVQFRVGRFMKLAIAAFVGLLITLASSTTVQETLMGYVYKRHSASMEQALSSRSGGIAAQWESFLDAPLTGFGFGIYRWGLGPLGAVEFMGIPISAPVEKGFLPTAILEEIGIFGALSFLVVLVVLGRRVVARRNARWLAIFFACIFVNVGEMGIFSVGGIGLFYWLMIGVSIRVSRDEEIVRTTSRTSRLAAQRVRMGQLGRAPGMETTA